MNLSSHQTTGMVFSSEIAIYQHIPLRGHVAHCHHIYMILCLWTRSNWTIRAIGIQWHRVIHYIYSLFSQQTYFWVGIIATVMRCTINYYTWLALCSANDTKNHIKYICVPGKCHDDIETCNRSASRWQRTRFAPTQHFSCSVMFTYIRKQWVTLKGNQLT
jgi:hypothetical protein